MFIPQSQYESISSSSVGVLPLSYQYDGVDRLTRINYPQPGTPYSTYEYNGDGLRVKVREKTGLITRYVWSGSDVINEYTDTWTLLKSYYLGGGLEGLIAGTTYSYYHPDGLGSIMKITGSTGTVTDTYDFDEFGNQIFNQGTTQNVYRYTGQQSDADSSMYYLRARYYEPSTGRFVTRDPKKGELEKPNSLNPYIYCNNNPVNYTDPSGKNPFIAAAITIVIYIWQYNTLKHSCTYWRGITNKDINEALKALPEDCPKEKRDEIKKMLQKAQYFYRFYASPYCGLASGDFIVAMQKEYKDINFSLGKIPGAPPINYGTATLWYQTDKSTPPKRIDFQFYLGTDGAISPVNLMKNR